MQTTTDLKTLNGADSSNSTALDGMTVPISTPVTATSTDSGTSNNTDSGTSNNTDSGTPTSTDTRLVALTTENTLSVFDPTSPDAAVTVPLQNVEGDLLGIDTRPSDGMIYGLSDSDQLYTIDLDGFNSGRITGIVNLTDEEEALLNNNQLYFTLRTEDSPNGALQGQLGTGVADDIVAYGLPLEESQQVGDTVPPDTEATGSFNVFYEDTRNLLSIGGSYSGLTSNLSPTGQTDAEGNPPSSIQLRAGGANENGPIIRNFTVSDNGRFSGSFNLTEEEETQLLNDQLYINLPTANFPGGELRGQIDVELEDDIIGSAVLRSPQQTDGTSQAQGTYGYAFDATTNQFLSTGSFSGLDSPLLQPEPDSDGNPQSAAQLIQGTVGEDGPVVSNLNVNDNLAQLATNLEQGIPGDTISGIDFDPVSGDLRLVDTFGQNFRLNVDTGEVTTDEGLVYPAGDENANAETSMTGSAYTNSFPNATSTQLYNLDQLQDVLVLQEPANEGTLQTIGELGVDFGIPGGFDITSSADNGNTAFAISDSTLYNINLETGQATSIGMIGQDIAGRFLSLTAAAPGTAPDVDNGTDGNGDDDGNGDNGGNGDIQSLSFEMANGQTLEAGTVITSQYASQGITISTAGEYGAMIFNTDNPTGGDVELGANRGNALIISESGNSNDPNAADDGGTLSFEFDELVGIAEVSLLTGEAMCSSVSFFGEGGEKLDTFHVFSTQDGGYYELGVNAEQVSRMDVMLTGEAAITGVDFASTEMANTMMA